MKWDNVFYYRCVSGGEHPAHWQDHCLDFWSPQLCFSFPLNPGPAAEEMTIWGKQQRLITSPPTYPHSHSQTGLFLSVLLVWCPTALLNLHFYSFHLWGCEPWLMKLIRRSVLHTFRKLTHKVDLVFPLLLQFAPHLLSCRKNLGRVLQLAVHND